MSRREQIRMSDAEVAAFLAQERTVTCATLGPRGWPHLMPLWYALREPSDGLPWEHAPGAGPQLWAWTYAASQKVRNLERDHRATLQVETGGTYQELRGVMLETRAVIHRDAPTVRALARELFARQATSREPAAPPGQTAAAELPGEVLEMIDRQVPKRVALQFVEIRRASWDHRKLGGAY